MVGFLYSVNETLRIIGQDQTAPLKPYPFQKKLLKKFKKFKKEVQKDQAEFVKTAEKLFVNKPYR